MTLKGRVWRVAGFLVGLVVGATGAFIGLRQHNYSWMELKREGPGFLLMGKALDADLPLPHTTPPTGQAKFLNRGTGKGTEFGYLVKTKTDKLDVSRIPEKYFAVVYSAHLEFTLKDADGFVPLTTNSPSLELWSGRENILQGIAEHPIPDTAVERTKSIFVRLVADECETCRL
jgi:hypothetical protein